MKSRHRRIVGLIPARGGSKGLPGKNLRLLGGKPLLLHTVDAAKKSKCVTDVYVSSDDAAILDVARRTGCVSITRPPHLAADDSLAADVVRHFLSTEPLLEEEDAIIVYLQPTSPLRTAAHIDEALAEMIEAGAPGIVSVVEMVKSPYKAFRLDGRGHLVSLFREEMSNLGRQELPRTFAANGAIYAFQVKAFLERQGFPSNGSLPYVMAEVDSIDIDGHADLQRAERLFGEHHAA